jgi:hypothetical protein
LTNFFPRGMAKNDHFRKYFVRNIRLRGNPG